MKKIIIIIILLSIFLISNHLMDIADVAYEDGYGCKVKDNKVYSYHKETMLVNGLYEVNSNTQYHVSWYVSYLCFFILIFVSLKKFKEE